jgi:selenide,water dikinase
VDPNLLVGHAGADDAGVYRIDAERAIVMTVDFFPPIVDDPYDYGRVAAANSLSDVYAMGADPIAALNIAAFPDKGLPNEILGEIFRGGASVAKGAGIVIVGGHTVKDTELKYGLSVVGMVHPMEIVLNMVALVGE